MGRVRFLHNIPALLSRMPGPGHSIVLAGPNNIYRHSANAVLFCRMNYNIEEFNHLIRHRRSVFPKQFAEGARVDDEIVNQVVHNATWAPNHGKTEPWKFIVFTGEGLKKLAAFQSELYKETAGEKFKQATYENLQANPLKASHVIAICLKRDPNKKFPEVEEISAVACAVQNIYLSVTVYGLGGYWTTGGITYNEKSKPFFGLGEDDRLMGFFYIGKVGIPSVDATRRPVEEKVYWVKE
jgi:nitroreductase